MPEEERGRIKPAVYKGKEEFPGGKGMRLCWRREMGARKDFLMIRSSLQGVLEIPPFSGVFYFQTCFQKNTAHDRIEQALLFDTLAEVGHNQWGRGLG